VTSVQDKRVPLGELERLMRAEAALASHTEPVVVEREGWRPSEWDRQHSLLNAMLDDWQTRDRVRG
jgi:hypothetical protein